MNILLTVMHTFCVTTLGEFTFHINTLSPEQSSSFISHDPNASSICIKTKNQREAANAAMLYRHGSLASFLRHVITG